jgi:hypothetical protein
VPIGMVRSFSTNFLSWNQISKRRSERPAAGDFTQWETAAGGGNEHFYKHVVGNALTWENARVAAEALTICSGADKGYLVTLTTAKENAFVFHTLNLAEIIGLGPLLPVTRVGNG